MKRALIVLALIILVPVVGWKLAFPTFTYRYRLTIEVEVDGQVRQGSSVIEVSFQKNLPIANSPWGSRVIGQGAAVDLGEKGVLVSLLGGGGIGENVSAPYLILRAHPRYSSQLYLFPPDRNGLREVAASPMRQSLQAGNLPGFVWLPHPNDRKSARLVYPKQLPWNVAPSVAILNVQIETTDAPLTRKLSVLLPWLPAQYESKSEGYSRGNEFSLMAQHINIGIEP